MEQPPVPVSPDPEAAARVEAFYKSLLKKQNLFLGLLLGAVAAALGAAAWAAVTVATKYQIGWMAVGVGFLVGFAVRLGGRGIQPVFGVMGALLALAGCALGNLWTACGLLANEGGVSFFTVLSHLDLEVSIELLKAMFEPMDLLFYGIAVYEGYKFSFRTLSPQELSALTRSAA